MKKTVSKKKSGTTKKRKAGDSGEKATSVSVKLVYFFEIFRFCFILFYVEDIFVVKVFLTCTLLHHFSETISSYHVLILAVVCRNRRKRKLVFPRKL